VVYLIVGVDRRTFARWHTNVMARDAATAAQIAGARARADGIALAVAAAIGPYSTVVDVPVDSAISEAA
jgi:hypothetical protein